MYREHTPKELHERAALKGRIRKARIEFGAGKLTGEEFIRTVSQLVEQIRSMGDLTDMSAFEDDCKDISTVDAQQEPTEGK